MRIAVTSKGKDLTSKVDPRFARAPYLLVFDTSDENLEVIDNSQNVNAAHGAGIKAAENVVNKKVDIVVAGNFGPKAIQALKAADIKTVEWTEGTVSEAIELARNNKFKTSDKPSVEGHWE